MNESDKRRIELLSPAKNADIAREAILCGADSVYIGASEFGARANAGNSLEDIAALCRFARVYGAKVYLTLNTILKDAELPRAVKLLWDAYECGVDAAIIQDLGLLKCALLPLALHASTQCNIDSPDKARFLEACGFKTLVLARELSLGEIAAIRKAVSCRLECFVHGALCVAFSGQCYMSLALGGRSGNRGVCAQPCRVKYEFTDADGKEIAPPAHYLSLRDMNRIDSLGDLIDAGVDILKIEGRLKDASYVKNITAAYRRALDAQIAERPSVVRASFGESDIPFEPNPSKSFNRGFCQSRLRGRTEKCASFATPKSRGEFLGTIRRAFEGGFFFPNAQNVFNNNDGLLFEKDGKISGGAVSGTNGERVFVGRPSEAPQIQVGASLWRNRDTAFEKSTEARASRSRRVRIDASRSNADEWTFSMELLDGNFPRPRTSVSIKGLPIAENRGAALDRLKKSFAKLGDTPFRAEQNDIFARLSASEVPHMKMSETNSLRRTLADALRDKISALRAADRERPAEREIEKIEFSAPPFKTDQRANVLNENARKLYAEAGFDILKYAPEASAEFPKEIPAALTRHCILRELGLCKKLDALPSRFREPFRLRDGDKILRLRFDCANCQMEIGLF